MKKKLIRVRARKIDSQKHENDTCESEGAHKQEFIKLTKIEVQTHLEVRSYQC